MQAACCAHSGRGPGEGQQLYGGQAVSKDGGNTTLRDIFNAILCSGVPVAYPLVIYAVLTGGRGRVAVGLRLIRDGGELLHEYAQECDFPHPERLVTLGHEHAVTFEQVGTHRLQLLADGCVLAEGRLEVAVIEHPHHMGGREP